MPWTKKQIKLAHAVEHGFKPTGKAAGFTTSFAEKVIDESARTRKAVSKMGKGAHAAPKR